MTNKIKNSLLILVTSILWVSCNNRSSTEVSSPETGELNDTFVDQQVNSDVIPQQNFERDQLMSEGWNEEYIENGQFPPCYNFSPKKGSVNNHLEIFVGGGTDVSIKVMNLITNKCVRYVFIKSGSKYSVNNIPEGKYYLKIAYGKNWLSKVENGKCIGKFMRNPMYEKGEDIMDFNIQHSASSYSVPSFKLQLDVVSSGISNSFESQNISESEFNQ